jgi:DNA-directed RNA polymerase III subunit RPC1
MAILLTYPERVTPHNIEALRDAIRRGPLKHPGANFVEYQNGVKVFLKVSKELDRAI